MHYSEIHTEDQFSNDLKMVLGFKERRAREEEGEKYQPDIFEVDEWDEAIKKLKELEPLFNNIDPMQGLIAKNNYRFYFLSFITSTIPIKDIAKREISGDSLRKLIEQYQGDVDRQETRQRESIIGKITDFLWSHTHNSEGHLETKTPGMSLDRLKIINRHLHWWICFIHNYQQGIPDKDNPFCISFLCFLEDHEKHSIAGLLNEYEPEVFYKRFWEGKVGLQAAYREYLEKYMAPKELSVSTHNSETAHPPNGNALTLEQIAYIRGAGHSKTNKKIIEDFEDEFGFKITDRTVRNHRNKK